MTARPSRRLRRPRAFVVPLLLALGLLALAHSARSHGNGFTPPPPVLFGPGKGPSDAGGPGGPTGSGGTSPKPKGPANGSAPSGPLPRLQQPATNPSSAGTQGSVGKQGTAGWNGGASGPDLNGSVPDSWELWWHDNEERFLALRSKLVEDAPSSGRGALTGFGRVERGGTRRAAAAQVEREVLPLLFELLTRDEDPELQDSALIALGRCADAGDADRVLMAVRPLLASDVLNVQTSAVLALGIHGSPTFVPLLGALMSDAPAGRAAVGGGAVPPLIRALAALSLGLGNHAAAVPLLSDLVRNLPDAEAQLKACVITALGVTGNEAEDVALGALLELLKDRRLDAPLAAHVPLALARLAGGARAEAVPALVAAFASRDTDDLVRVSVATALGRLAAAQDTAAVEALDQAARSSRHDATRHAALMALVEIGRRDVPAELHHPELHKRLATFLKKGLAEAASHADRAWLALAAGVYANGGGAEATGLQGALFELQREQKDPSTRGAFDLALGLSRCREAADAVLKDFRDDGDALLRGHAAQSLGLLGIRDAVPEMRSLCGDNATEPIVREQVALGLALLRDEEVVPRLVDVLGRVQIHGVSLAVARSLGRIGDRSAIPALAELARDAGRNPSTRGMAVVALGLIGERGELPWNAALRELHNPEASVDALTLVFDIL